jgi:hypothetical protein
MRFTRATTTREAVVTILKEFKPRPRGRTREIFASFSNRFQINNEIEAIDSRRAARPLGGRPRDSSCGAARPTTPSEKPSPL